MNHNGRQYQTGIYRILTDLLRKMNNVSVALVCHLHHQQPQFYFQKDHIHTTKRYLILEVLTDRLDPFRGYHYHLKSFKISDLKIANCSLMPNSAKGYFMLSNPFLHIAGNTSISLLCF